MKILESYIHIDTKNNITSTTILVRCFSKKMKIRSSILSGDLAHCILEEERGLRKADKYLNRQINKFNNRSIFK